MNSFWEELKRRNVIKASLACLVVYLVISRVLLQVASIILPIVGSPDWVYEITPEGINIT